MKTALQAFLSSVIIHFIYIWSTLGIGYIKTKYYKPEILNERENIHFLQNEVTLGMVISPLGLISSLLGVSIICAFIILLYKKLLS